ncbi:MAG: NAD(P)-dependent oxidoreductase [Acidobacteria bacterium]|nr:NAD(P)-dependent oxidoreductase [Acidobacteriota bacterium]
MGSRIARRLCICGIPVVAFNRTQGRGKELENFGATFVDSPMEVGLAARIIFTAVTGPDDVREVLIGPLGVCRSQSKDLIVIDLSTIDPTSSFEIAQKLSKSGIKMLDAPMSGSVHDAERGTLGFLVGGKANVIDQVRPIMDQIGTVYHFGPNGNGCIAKLSLNLLLASMVQSLGEAFALLDVFGISRELILSAVATSGLSSPLFERVGTRVLAGDFEPRFVLRDLQKDLSLLNKVSMEAGLDLRVAGLLRQIVSKAKPQFLDQDYSALMAAETERISAVELEACRRIKERDDAGID